MTAPLRLLQGDAPRKRPAYRQSALMPGNEDKVGYWLTPPDLMARLQEEFHFDFDSCPYPRPAGFDGLKVPWGRSTYCNPPYERRISSWTRKAVTEAEAGKTVVLILPVQGWVDELLTAGAEYRPMGRVPWMDTKGRVIGRPRWPSALFILRPQARQEGP